MQHTFLQLRALDREVLPSCLAWVLSAAPALDMNSQMPSRAAPTMAAMTAGFMTSAGSDEAWPASGAS